MRPLTPPSHRRDAFATIGVLALLAIMAALLAVNLSTIRRAFQEVRLVEQRQQRQHPWLDARATNTVPRRRSPAP